MDNPAPASVSNTPSDSLSMSQALPMNVGPRVSVDQLLLAGAHFGHLTQRWNPKMKRFIFMARNGIYLIDLQKTQVMLEAACAAIAKIAATGEEILFIGTKKQARDVIETEAKRARCPYMTYRWLGGTLTNYSTIRKSLKTLEGHEKMGTDGTYEKLNKKEQLTIEKEKGKLNMTLGGIREMRRLPGAVFIVDTKRESIAVAEARKLKIPIFAIVDTNVDPDLIDHPVPANDDAFKSIWLITHAITDAILEGKRAVRDVAPSSMDHEERDRERDNQRGDRNQRRRRPAGTGPGGSAGGREPQQVDGVRNEGGDRGRSEHSDRGGQSGGGGSRPGGGGGRPGGGGGGRPGGGGGGGSRPGGGGGGGRPGGSGGRPAGGGGSRPAGAGNSRPGDSAKTGGETKKAPLEKTEKTGSSN